MAQILVVLSVLAAVGAAPVEDVSFTPYRYEYSVSVPETGDEKAHYEERDPEAIVVGSFRLVDPNGDLRKLSYRVQGDSGFVITDMQVMPGFAPPPPPPAPYTGDSGSQAAPSSSAAEGVAGAGAGAEDAGAGAEDAGDGAGDGGDAEGSAAGGQSGVSGEEGAAAAGGDDSEGGEGSSSSSESSSSEGSSEEAASSEEVGSSEGEDAAEDQQQTLGGVDGGTAATEPGSPQDSRLQGKRVNIDGPAFVFSIVQTKPNRFEVKENVIGHEVQFETHGVRE